MKRFDIVELSGRVRRRAELTAMYMDLLLEFDRLSRFGVNSTCICSNAFLHTSFKTVNEVSTAWLAVDHYNRGEFITSKLRTDGQGCSKTYFNLNNLMFKNIF